MYSKSIRDIQSNALLELLHNENNTFKDFSDVKIIIGKVDNQKEYRANKAMLSAHSKVFKDIFYVQLKKTHQHPECDHPEAFKCVLNYCYCSNPGLSLDNVISVQNLASYYQIKALEHLCFRYYFHKIQLDVNNFCQELQKFICNDLDDFVGECKEFLMDQDNDFSKTLINTHDFLMMDTKSMKVLLQWEGLDVDEEQLWNSIMKWSGYDEELESNSENDGSMSDDVVVNSSNNGKKRKMKDDFFDQKREQKKRKLMTDNENQDDHEDDDLKVQDNSHNKNNSSKDKNELTNALALKKLTDIAPFIHFKLMRKNYFEEKVKKLEILDKERIDVINKHHNQFGGGLMQPIRRG